MATPSERARAALLQAIGEIAPDANLTALRGDAPLRETLDLDSMDFLRVVARIGELLGIDVPAAETDRLATLDGAVAWLATRLAP